MEKNERFLEIYHFDLIEQFIQFSDLYNIDMNKTMREYYFGDDHSSFIELFGEYIYKIKTIKLITTNNITTDKGCLLLFINSDRYNHFLNYKIQDSNNKFEFEPIEYLFYNKNIEGGLLTFHFNKTHISKIVIVPIYKSFIEAYNYLQLQKLRVMSIVDI